ncbi:transcriptional regulator domain-containing protein [Pseudochelatococcus sp. B33]
MSNAQDWMANAAYLYILFLDRPAIAWEHLRRNPDYRNDWSRFGPRRHSSSAIQARRWGLRFP